MKHIIILSVSLAILSLSPVFSQQQDRAWYKEDGKWYINIDGKHFGPFTCRGDFVSHDDRWLLMGATGGENRGNIVVNGKYHVYTNIKGFEKSGPYDYVDGNLFGFSRTGKCFYYMAFNGDDTTANQKYYYVINGKQYGPYTKKPERIKFYCDDDIWAYRAISDGSFRDRWHYGGQTRLYVMDRVYTPVKGPIGWSVEDVEKISDNRYRITLSVDAGSRNHEQVIEHTINNP